MARVREISDINISKNERQNTYGLHRAVLSKSRSHDPSQIDPISRAMLELMSRMHPAMCQPPSHLNTCDDRLCRWIAHRRRQTTNVRFVFAWTRPEKKFKKSAQMTDMKCAVK